MKVGDLIRVLGGSGKIGVVVEMNQKKCWRTHTQGKKIDWDKVDPEPHAVVLFSDDSGMMNIPTVELEVVHEK